MRLIPLIAAACLFLSPLASAESSNSVTSAATTKAAATSPSVKIINFTADWCPNCQILNPRMDEAISSFAPGLVQRIDLDMTAAKGPHKMRAFADAIRLADSHQTAYLWDWYGGVTGIAAIVASDTGEPLTCMTRRLTTRQIQDRLAQAIILAENAPAGQRRPDGPDCPAPMR